MRPTKASKFVEQHQHLDRRLRIGKVAHVEVDQLLEQQVIERGDPIQLIRGNAKINRHGLHPQGAKVKVALLRGGIDARVEPKAELGGYSLDDAGKGVLSARSKIGKSIAASGR